MNSPVASLYEFGPFQIDAARRLLFRNGQPVTLTPKAFDLLLVLVENRERLVEKSELMQRIWPDSFVEETNLSQNVSTLRKALGENAKQHQYVVTVPGRGYRFVANVGISRPDAQQIRKDEPTTVTRSSVDLLDGSKPKPGVYRRTAVALAGCGLLAGIIFLGLRWRPQIEEKPIDSLAVLPFVNSSADVSAEYLSDGISDGIIDSLSHLPNLKRVVPFSSVLRFKGKQVESLAVGRELNVRALLTGRLTQHGDDLSISVELVDVDDNKLLWGEQYDRKLADVPKLQGEIARDISEKLRLKLTAEQKEQLTKRYTENGEAYQLYLQGRYFGSRRTDEGYIRGLDFYQKAIDKDSNFALGYAGLADSYIDLAAFGLMPPKEAWQKAEAAAVKALAIDDRLGQAHCSLGFIKRLHDWDWAGAEQEFKRANELNPESADSHVGYAYLLEGLGRFDEAIDEAKRSQQVVDPLNPMELVEILYFARRYDEAVDEGLKRLKEGNSGASLHITLGEVYVQQGKYEQALVEMLKARALVVRPRQLARIGYVYAAAGKKDEAIKLLTEVKGQTSERYDLDPYIAAIYAALGNKDKAFEWLKKACDQRERGVFDLKVSPRWDTLRSDSRFTALLWRMKLAW